MRIGPSSILEFVRVYSYLSPSVRKRLIPRVRPQDLLEVTLDSAPEVPRTSLMPRTRQAAPIVDFAWYPTATRRDPASFCFVASVRECPVKLIDASDGRVSGA